MGRKTLLQKQTDVISYTDFLDSLVQNINSKLKNEYNIVMYFPYLTKNHNPEFYIIFKEEHNFVYCMSRIGKSYQVFIVHTSNIIDRDPSKGIYIIRPVKVHLINDYKSPLIPIECPESSKDLYPCYKVIEGNKYLKTIISNDFNYTQSIFKKNL